MCASSASTGLCGGQRATAVPTATTVEIQRGGGGKPRGLPGGLAELAAENAAENAGRLPEIAGMLVEMHKRHSGPHRIYEPDPEIVRQFSALGTWEQLCELYGWVMRDGGAGAYSGGVARVVYFVALGLNRIHRINEAERVAALATVRRAVQRSAA